MPGFWRTCRITFRWFRITVWLLVLAVLGLLLWCNRVGLPDFLKTRLVAALHEQGVQLEFSRMRLSLVRGLVAENVHLATAGQEFAPAFTARQVRLDVDFTALWHRRLELDGLGLRDGAFSLPLSPTNGLTLTNLQSVLRFGTNDTWTLERFRASFAGADITISGRLAHAREALDWKIFAGGTTNRGNAFDALRDFAATLARIKFAGTPQLALTLSGDARDIHTVAAQLHASAGGVQTPWLNARNFMADFSLTAPAAAPTNRAPALGFWSDLLPFKLTWNARLDELRSATVNGYDLACDGVWSATEKSSAPSGGGAFNVASRLHARVGRAQTPWFDARNFVADLQLTAPAPTSRDPAQGFWTNLPPFNFTWATRLDEIHSAKLNAAEVVCDGAWAAPQLDLAKLSAKLGGGQASLGAQLDTVSRQLAFTNAARLDPQIFAGFLPSKARAPLAKIKLNEPPAWQVEGSLRLPAWTNFSLAGDSLNRLTATLALRGELGFTNAVIHGLALDRARTQFQYDGRFLSLSNLEVAQGKTQLRLGGELSEATGNFHARLAGRLAAATIQDLLPDTNALRAFDHLTFHQPLAFKLDAAGNWRHPATLSATGHVALADFAIRGQSVDLVASDLSYTNLAVVFHHPQLARAGGRETFTADQVTLDIPGERIFFEGGRGAVEPYVVARAIGPKTFEGMEPFQFLSIPNARVHGCVPFKQKHHELVTDDADLWFDIAEPVPFRWRKFETKRITGSIHWLKDYIILTNAVAECYGGQAEGWGVFDVSPEIHGTDFSFFMTGTNVDFHRMSQALWAPTNRLEGTLAGTVFVTRANSDDWHTWNGYGRAQLQNGLIWDVPIFSIMSPVLNAMSSGLGNSRATEATADFQMTNGVISADSLLIKARFMRLQYAGTVNLEQNVNARVTAQLLRNTPVLGSLVSTVLWPVSKALECKVTGTLQDPVIKPIYIPRLLLAPLHPFRSLEELFASPAATSAPAK